MTKEERKVIERGPTARPVEVLENGVVHEVVNRVLSEMDCVWCTNCDLDMLVEMYADACPVCGVESLAWHAATYGEDGGPQGNVADEAWEDYFFKGEEPPRTPDGEPRSRKPNHP